MSQIGIILQHLQFIFCIKIVIQSLRLLGDADEADFFREQVLRLLGDASNKIPPRTMKFWKEA